MPFLLVLFCCCGGLLRAQSVDTLPLTTTTEVVEITASKFPLPAKATPRRVTVIDSARLARAVTGDLTQLLQEELGLVLTGAYANPGQNKSLSLRGSGSAYTLLLIDGIPVTDPSAIGSVVDLRLISPDQLARIEVLRGPASLLYGADATAGVVNLITKQGGGAGPGGQLRLSYGSLNTRQAALSVRNTGKRVDFRAAYDRYATDGISEARRPEGDTTAFDRDGLTRENFSAALTARVGEHLTVRPSLRLAGFDGAFDSGAFRDGTETYTNSLVQPALAVDYGRNNLSLALRLTGAQTQREFRFAFGPVAYDGHSTVADLFGRYRFGERTDLLLGLQSRRERILPVAEGGTDARATTVSPYAQLRHRFSERLTAEAGGRYNVHSAYGGQANFSLAGRYALTERLTGRLSVASGHQNPTLDQLFGPFGANTDLQPQVVTSGELGLDVTAPAGRWGAIASLFRRLTQDLITYDFAAGYRNVAEASDWGGELGGHYRPLEALRLRVGLSYTDGQLRTPDGNGGTTEQTDFLRRPALKVTAAATYETAGGLLLRLSALRIGERDDRYFTADFSAVDVTLSPYLLTNFYAEQRLLREESLRLFVDVRNLLDADFTETAGFGALGRFFTAGVSYQLGSGR